MEGSSGVVGGGHGTTEIPASPPEAGKRRASLRQALDDKARRPKRTNTTQIPPREGKRPTTVPFWPSLLHVAPSGGIPSNEVTPGTLLIRPLFAPCFFLFSVLSLSRWVCCAHPTVVTEFSELGAKRGSGGSASPLRLGSRYDSANVRRNIPERLL